MRPGRALLVVALLAAPALAALPDDAPMLEVVAPDAGVAPAAAPTLQAPRANYLLPVLESEFLHFGLMAFSNLVTRQPFAQISLDSIASHFDGRRPWQFDVDFFFTNQFGHPYQGALSFTAARSAGVPFWLATIYPLLASLSWELFYEIDAPAINDQITTTLGGIFLGEVLHRAAALVLSDTGGGTPSWVRQVGSFLLSPAGAINHWLTNGELDAQDLDENPPYFAHVSAGVNIGGVLRDPGTRRTYLVPGVQFNVQASLTYGIPGDPAFRYRHPFSHFALDANLLIGAGAVTGGFFTRGLLWGAHFGNASTSVRGVWGVFGQYDFSAASLARVSSVAVGLGASLQWKLGTDVFLQATGMLSGVPFASAGALGVEDVTVRDYHIGAGAQATTDLRLLYRDLGWLRLTARNWFIVGAYTQPTGWESISYVTFGPLGKLWGPIGLGADVVVVLRRTHFPDNGFAPQVNGVTGRITLSWLSDGHFGLVDRR